VDRTPANAVVLAALHSGSVDYYSDRLTLRWDVMPPDDLRPLLGAIRARGQRVYLVLDENYEVDTFRRRFLDGRDGSVRLEPLDRIFTVQLFELTPPS
jgi:hypothetical protein